MNHNQRVGRNIYKLRCKGVYLNDVKETKEFDIVLYGNLSEKKAINQIKKQLGFDSVMLLETELNREYYSMPIEDFIKYADRKV